MSHLWHRFQFVQIILAGYIYIYIIEWVGDTLRAIARDRIICWQEENQEAAEGSQPGPAGSAETGPADSGGDR